MILVHFWVFQTLALTNKPAVKFCVQFFVWTVVFLSPTYTARSGIAGSHSKSMFKCLRNCQSVFQSSCTGLPSHQQYMRGPTLHVILTLVFVHLCDSRHPGGLKWNQFVVLICIFLMINDVEHLFTTSSATHIS